MLHGEELKPLEEGKNVTLANCIFAFPCLKNLKYSSKETEKKLSAYLNLIRDNRNTSDGNGAHSSYLLNEQQLDDNIKAFTTLYLYVIGMNLEDIKKRYNNI